MFCLFFLVLFCLCFVWFFWFCSVCVLFCFFFCFFSVCVLFVLLCLGCLWLGCLFGLGFVSPTGVIKTEEGNSSGNSNLFGLCGFASGCFVGSFLVLFALVLYLR